MSVYRKLMLAAILCCSASMTLIVVNVPLRLAVLPLVASFALMGTAVRRGEEA